VGLAKIARAVRWPRGWKDYFCLDFLLLFDQAKSKLTFNKAKKYKADSSTIMVCLGIFSRYYRPLTSHLKEKGTAKSVIVIDH
jgi:hypothetical protein